MRELTIKFAAILTAAASLAACTTVAPNIQNPAAAGAALLLTGSNSDVIAGQPRTIYERLARQATQCWFGPFGSVHDRYMMHADVPPPSSAAPVTMAVHRRLKSRKKPWGPKLLRVELKGKSTTTISYQNVGLDPATMSRMTNAFTRWANGRKTCSALHGAQPQWAPLPVSAQTNSAQRK